jgi:hypothetical protein
MSLIPCTKTRKMRGPQRRQLFISHLFTDNTRTYVSEAALQYTLGDKKKGKHFPAQKLRVIDRVILHIHKCRSNTSHMWRHENNDNCLVMHQSTFHPRLINCRAFVRGPRQRFSRGPVCTCMLLLEEDIAHM